jgi:hypothetical protein
MKNSVGASWSNNAASPQQANVEKEACFELVNLNDVLKDSLFSFEKELKNGKAIYRHDELPLVRGNKKELVQLFSNLLHSILYHPPVHTKLLIYFRVQKQGAEVMDLSLPDGFINYTVSVYTNILGDENWRLKNEALLNDCSSIVSEIKGYFTFYNISTTGCLYNLQLPGKDIK